MPARAEPQTSIYEKVVEDAELEAKLERREELRQAKADATSKFREVDEETRGLISERLELGVGAVVRIGNFIVTKKRSAGGTVSFEKQPKERLSISLIDEDE